MIGKLGAASVARRELTRIGDSGYARMGDGPGKPHNLSINPVFDSTWVRDAKNPKGGLPKGPPCAADSIYSARATKPGLWPGTGRMHHPVLGGCPACGAPLRWRAFDAMLDRMPASEPDMRCCLCVGAPQTRAGIRCKIGTIWAARRSCEKILQLCYPAMQIDK